MAESSEGSRKGGSQILDARRLLVDWANQQDSWVRSLVGQTVASYRAISDGQAKELFDQFLAEKGLRGPLAPKVASETEVKSAVPPHPKAGSHESEPLRLLTLSNVSGVNALSPGAKIDFSPGLTILHGENGTGKTGYARVLKRISAVQYPEEILPNIHSPTPQMPSATVEYHLGSVQKTFQWHNETGVSPLTRMSVFDSPTVNLRVDESLSFVFTPAEISLFSYVSSGIRMIQELGSRTHAEMTLTNPFVRHFHEVQGSIRRSRR